MDVDMGAMTLPVGEGHVGADQGPSEAADPLTVARFRQAMDERPRSARVPALEDNDLPSPFALLGAPEAQAAASAEELGALIERLWVNDGVSSIREVRVKLRREILPDTSVRLYEAGGRLQVALTVSEDATRRWLESALPALTSDLGMRLNRPLRVALVSVNVSTPGVSWDWPEAIKQ
jgi:hypothetical protein